MNCLNLVRLVFVSGKGGVGKTTFACGLARQWAREFPDEQILLLSTDPAHSLGDVLLMEVEDMPRPVEDLSNLFVRSLDAETLLESFRSQYGEVLQLLVERGSFVQGEDLSPVWDLAWPGVDELMGILEIQRILHEQKADRVVVDMAPSGHTLSLFGLMDFLDQLLNALNLFQENHRTIHQSLTGQYAPDSADRFLAEMKTDLANGRSLLQNAEQTACFVIAIAESMSYLETCRFLKALHQLHIPLGGLVVNRLIPIALPEVENSSPLSAFLPQRQSEQQELLAKFITLAAPNPVFTLPLQPREPIGAIALDHCFTHLQPVQADSIVPPTGLLPLILPKALPITLPITLPTKYSPGFSDFIVENRRLLLVGGKGGVGKTTVSAAIGWGLAERHPDCKIRVISIDPAHSLGDAFGITLSHKPVALTANLSGQEVDAKQVLEQFRADYLWELAEMMSGATDDDALQIAYAPEAWRQIVAQALPGIDEMLSLLTVMELLEQGEQDLIILDTAPTGHLLRFLEMPTALADWLAWIFKLWIKYQDVVGRTAFMGRLRSLRQRVVQAQKKLINPNHTEFIGVFQAQSAIVAEAERLTHTLSQMHVSERYVVQNRYCVDQNTESHRFPEQIVVRLPELPRAIDPQNQIKIAAQMLF
ncbi:arsenic transporter [filamentous cyanobacterium CCP1]|nr:arsenic transporter [filamentous cyanobacterium CCP2]PSB66717.1 arsenic transporter [filamentous cyanobacterium CCP1]